MFASSNQPKLIFYFYRLNAEIGLVCLYVEYICQFLSRLKELENTK